MNTKLANSLPCFAIDCLYKRRRIGRFLYNGSLILRSDLKSDVKSLKITFP